MTTAAAAIWAAGANTNKPAPVNPEHRATATVAGGCFWGLQETLQKIPGVITTTVGYTGGTTKNPTYESVVTRKTGHMEAVKVTFDPTKVNYENLLVNFLNARNPLAKNGAKSAHCSTIFYHDEEQRQSAERVKEKLNHSGKWNEPVVGEIHAATKFYPAEKYHQNYYQKSAATRACGAD